MTTSRPAALIVEDQPFIGMVASDILRESGFETFHAFDADAASQMLDAHPEIGLLITEAALPGGGNGVEFAARVAATRPDMRLLIAATRGSEPAGAMPAGAKILLKPFASGELRELAGGTYLLQDG